MKDKSKKTENRRMVISIDKSGKQYFDLPINNNPNTKNITKRDHKQFKEFGGKIVNRPIPSRRLFISLLAVFITAVISNGFSTNHILWPESFLKSTKSYIRENNIFKNSKFLKNYQSLISEANTLFYENSDAAKIKYAQILQYNPTNIHAQRMLEYCKPMIEQNLVDVSGGTFLMGEDAADENEQPIHEVEISDFKIGRYEVTNTQYAIFLNEYKSEIIDENDKTYVIGKDGDYKGKKLIDLLGGFDNVKCRVYNDARGIFRAEIGFEHNPVLFVNWFGAYEFCRFYGLSLPTEAQWEYASRGGKKKDKTETGNLKYAGSNDLNKVGWYSGNSNHNEHTVGMKKANPLGLYDITGNVAEWCIDWYGFYKKEKQTNPKGNDTGINKILRGGSWFIDADLCRNTARMNSSPDTSTDTYGFRYVKNN